MNLPEESNSGIILSFKYKKTMSQAFVEANDEQWLHDIPPSLSALINYLTRENNGIRVYEQKKYVDATTGKEVHVMSNGLSYSTDKDSKWYVV